MFSQTYVPDTVILTLFCIIYVSIIYLTYHSSSRPGAVYRLSFYPCYAKTIRPPTPPYSTHFLLTMISLLSFHSFTFWSFLWYLFTQSLIFTTNQIRIFGWAIPKLLMTMIAFMIWNSSLIPFIEGLFSSNPYRFELSVTFRSQAFAFLFRKKKYVKEKRHLVQDFLQRLLAYM